MSLYADYVKLENKNDIIETKYGFITYQLIDKEMFISDTYADPDAEVKYRYEIWDSAKKLAKESGCTVMSCLVWIDPTRVDYTTRKVKTFLGHGFKVKSADKNTIVLVREV